MRALLCFLLATAPWSIAQAQLTGTVDAPALGLAFVIPAGWSGMEQDGTWGLVKEDVAGTVFISTHEHHDLATLEQDMTAVPTDDPPNRIQQVGPVRHPFPNAIELDFRGTMEWQPVWIGAVGMISDAGGPGLSIVALGQGTEPNLPLLEAAMSVIESVRFTPPVTPPVVEQWRTHLSGTRLTYVNRYGSPSSTDGGIGGGTTTFLTIDLCPQGDYVKTEASDLTISGEDASVARADGREERGTWSVEVSGADNARLVLRSADGRLRSYTLEDQGGATMLEGERWFRTTASDGTYAPACEP